MSTVMKELKAEISRLARREIKKDLAPVKRVNAAQRGRIAALRRQVAALHQELNTLRKTVATRGAGAGPVPTREEKGRRFWITGKGVRSLRKRLGLTQAGLAKLAGVSVQTVVVWERDPKKISLRRKETVVQLQTIRKLTRRAAQDLLRKRPKSKAS